MRQSRRPVDFSRAHALQYLDAALGADRRQLFKQYVESLRIQAEGVRAASGRRASISRRASSLRYQHVLETALAPSAFGRWKPQVPILFARLVHYYGTDAKLRVCRHERWIPAKWVELHRTYMRASELGVERVATVARRRPWQRHAVDGRAGVRVRAARASAQHRQPVAGQARLGRFADSRVEPAPRARCAAEDDGGLLRRPRRPHRAACAAPARIRARCCATSTRRRSPSSST